MHRSLLKIWSNNACHPLIKNFNFTYLIKEIAKILHSLCKMVPKTRSIWYKYLVQTPNRTTRSIGEIIELLLLFRITFAFYIVNAILLWNKITIFEVRVGMDFGFLGRSWPLKCARGHCILLLKCHETLFAIKITLSKNKTSLVSAFCKQI